MRFWWRAGLACSFGILCAILLIIPTRAENVTVTIGVGDTILTVTGKTSPDAFVTVSKDGGVIGTTVADSSGAYTQTFPAQDPGLHELSVFAHTTSGKNTDSVTLTVNIAEHATTTASIFLPTTFTVEDDNLSPTQPLVLSGEAAPSSTVTIYIDNNNFASTSTDAAGNWILNLNVSSLASGQHQLFARVVDGFGDQSYPTASRYFSREGLPTTPTPQPIPSPSEQSRPAPDAPTITFPNSDTIWREPTITVVGTADPRAQIELWDGSNLIGSVWSGPRGDWSITVLLEAKAYSLRARACKNTVCSGFSSIVQLTHEPSGALSPLGRPLRIHLPQASFVTYQNMSLTVRATILDGQPPYRVGVMWSDLPEEVTTSLSNELTLNHRYTKPGRYTVPLEVQDAQGRKGKVFFTVHVKPSQPTRLSIALFALTFIFAIGALTYLIRIRHRMYKQYKK